jgi:hypothetical protein
MGEFLSHSGIGRRARSLRFRGIVAGVAGAVMLSSVLAACTSAAASTGPVTLNFYANPDVSGATAKIVAACSAQSRGQYTGTRQSRSCGLKQL